VLGAPRKLDDTVLIALLASSATNAEIAAKLGVSTRTVTRNRARPVIQAAAEALKERRRNEVRAQLETYAAEAATVLGEELHNEDPRIRIAAGKVLVDRFERSRPGGSTATPAVYAPAAWNSWPGWDPNGFPIPEEQMFHRPAALAAIRQRRWCWGHIGALIDGAGLEGARRQIRTRARGIRSGRAEGFDFEFTSALQRAAYIASYLPEEVVPMINDDDAIREPWSYLDRDLARLGGSSEGTPTYLIGLEAAVLKLAMGTHDAIELRREIWGPEPPEDITAPDLGPEGGQK